MDESRENETSSRTGTEYKLSISSNPGSRRSSLASQSNNNDGFGAKGMASGAFDAGADQNVLNEFLVPQIRELTDSVVTLDGNMGRLSNIHNNLVELNESFGSLLYGIMCTSACTDFPGVTPNIERELRSIKRLHSLKRERAALELELYELQNPSRKGAGKRGGEQRFSEPLFPSRHVPSMSALATHTRGGSARTNDTPNDNNLYDDSVSEESFVLNPPVQPATDTRSKGQWSNGAISKRSSKLRRRSILDTIRNSIRTDDSSAQSGVSRRTIGAAEARHSVGAPSRNTTQIPADRSRRNTYAAAPGSRNNDTRRSAKPQPGSRSKVINKRPPFR